MLWERWGHPPGESDYRSGFEEELELAKARWTRDGLPEIWLFLKDIDSIRPTTLCSFSATIVRMASSAISVRFDEHTMWIELTDGRTLGLPLAWFPRLLRATPAEREQVTLSHAGLHWEAIDEDISIAGLLAGRGDMTRSTGHAV